MTPCRHCGAPIEQRIGRGRPKVYCPEGDCQAAAKREREMRRATPGLEGSLARAEELYDRMEKGLAAAIEPLAQVLTEELSPAGVEAKLSAVQAEAHTRIAIARTEREQAFEQVRLSREAADAARAETEEMRRQVAEADAERDTAFADAETAREQALAALSEAATTERRARQAEEEAHRRADLAEAARGQAVRELADRVDKADADVREAQAEAVQAGKERERALADAGTARTEAELARRAHREAERSSDAAIARAQAAEAERDRAVSQAEAERDRAVSRAEAERDRALSRAEAAESARALALADAARAKAETSQATEREQAAEGRASLAAEDAARAADQAGTAVAERNRIQAELMLERARLEDIRGQLDAARAESAQLRERAVAAELRAKD